MWSGGKLFYPRGLSGIQKLVRAEMTEKLSKEVRISRDGIIEGITDIGRISKLRIPQSVWIPLIEKPVKSVKDFKQCLGKVDWETLPRLDSHGPRISVSKDNFDFRKSDKEEMLSVFSSATQKSRTEFSIRIGQDGLLSLSINAIPPRPWIDSPAFLSKAQRETDWGASVPAQDNLPERPTDSAIRIFRNDSSLSCLCAAFLQTTSFAEWASNEKRGELVVWDPFAGKGSMIMEMLVALMDSGNNFQRNVTIVATAKSTLSADALRARIDKFVSAFPDQVSLIDTVVAASGSGRKGGRKSSRSSRVEENESDISGKNLLSVSLNVNSTLVDIHITTVSVHETAPYISGGLVLSHIPKTYNELTGIDKHQLSEWTAFGALMKSRSNDLEAAFLSETNSFAKYSKMKFFSHCHLVSPNGKSVGSFAKWLRI